jgi:broad specificity phosphatase PhoE
MALYFVRHGETDWNRVKRFQSTSDVPLNERGLAQAACLANELLRREIKIGELRCSPLQRAVKTAQIIGDRLGVNPIVDERITELPFGDWEGMFEADLATQFGEQFQTWRDSHYTLAPPGGQCLRDAADRLRPALGDLLEPSLNGNTMVVAHQAIMMAMKAALTDDYSVAAAYSYKQNNDEVDVWDLRTLNRLDFFKFECPA